MRGVKLTIVGRPLNAVSDVFPRVILEYLRLIEQEFALDEGSRASAAMATFKLKDTKKSLHV